MNFFGTKIELQLLIDMRNIYGYLQILARENAGEKFVKSAKKRNLSDLLNFRSLLFYSRDTVKIKIFETPLSSANHGDLFFLYLVWKMLCFTATG